MRLPFAIALSCASALAWAQQQEVKLPPEPKVQRIVVEDDAVRIEELRVRGVTQRVVVKPKNAAEYEIVPAAGGQRVWNVLKF